MQLIVFGLPDMTREAGEPIHISGMNWPYQVFVAFEIVHFLITCFLVTALYCMNSKLKWKMVLLSEEGGRGSMHFSGSSAVYSLFFSVMKISYILQSQSREERGKLDDIPAWAFGLLFAVDTAFYLVICVRQCISIRMDPFRNEPEDMLDTYFLPWDGHLSCRGMSAHRANVLPAEQLPERDYWGEQAAREETASGDTATRAVRFGAAPAGVAVAATQATYASAQSTVMADASVIATPSGGGEL